MKFHIENFGPIKKADVQLNDVTIICGPNNSGKTYVTYAICIFLHFFWNKMSLDVPDTWVNEFLDKGAMDIRLEDYIPLYISTAKKTVADWRKYLPELMAMPPAHCPNAVFSIDITHKELKEKLSSYLQAKLNFTFKLSNTCEIRLSKEANNAKYRLILVNQNEDLPAIDMVKATLGVAFTKVFVNPTNYYLLDNLPMAITCERTGAVLFRDELFMSKQMTNGNQKAMENHNDLAEKLDFRGYQFPVASNLLYVIYLNRIVSQQSELSKHHPYIIEFFDKMAGGRYDYNTLTHQIRFHPDEDPNLSLSLSEVSSTVKSLLHLNFYLRYQACAGQMLIFDEPELDLHPANQRKMARLLAMMAQAGIDIFITTHSDYLIREFNTLIMLNAPDNKRLTAIAEELGYDKNHDNCLLEHSAINCYVVKNGTTKQMVVSPQYGIEVTSFDDTINEVNALQNRILYGDDK